MPTIPLTITFNIKKVRGFNSLILETEKGQMAFTNTNGKSSFSCTYTDNGRGAYTWSNTAKIVNKAINQNPPQDPCVLRGSGSANSVYSNNKYYYCCNVVGVRAYSYPWITTNNTYEGSWTMTLKTSNWKSKEFRVGFSKSIIHHWGVWYNNTSTLSILIKSGYDVLYDYTENITDIIAAARDGLYIKMYPASASEYLYTPTFKIISSINRDSVFIRKDSVSTPLNFTGNLKVERAVSTPLNFTGNLKVKRAVKPDEILAKGQVSEKAIKYNTLMAYPELLIGKLQ